MLNWRRDHTSDDEHALLCPSASGVAIPVSEKMTAEELRDLVTPKTIANVERALREHEGGQAVIDRELISEAERKRVEVDPVTF